ncbi:hypothetical protein KI387_029895, partial [Taxus chinensis]
MIQTFLTVGSSSKLAAKGNKKHKAEEASPKSTGHLGKNKMVKSCHLATMEFQTWWANKPYNHELNMALHRSGVDQILQMPYFSGCEFDPYLVQMVSSYGRNNRCSVVIYMGKEVKISLHGLRLCPGYNLCSLICISIFFLNMVSFL